MIRWSEQKDCYRLDVFDQASAGLYGCLAALLGSGSMLMFVISGLVGIVVTPWAWLGLVLVAGAGLACQRFADAHRSCCEQRGWVEVSIRGSMVRWGVSDPSARKPRQVVRFELMADSTGLLSVEAVLPDGGKTPVLGPWSRFSAAQMRTITEDLNANLGNVESSAATLTAPPREPK